MAVPIAADSPDHETLGSFPTVTTFSVTNTFVTPRSANKRSTRGEPPARSLFSKKNAPPGCTVRFTVNLQVSGSASNVSARIVIVGSTASSDIFDDPGLAALAKPPQVLERVNPGTMAIAPIDRDRIVAHGGDRSGGYVWPHALWIQERAPAHLFHA